MIRIGSLVAPRVVAAAFAMSPDVLRQWSAGHGGLPALTFLGETGRGGRRRYSYADAALIALVRRLADFGLTLRDAIAAANAVAPFIREMDQAYAPHGKEALVEMGDAAPVAVLEPAAWPSRWKATFFPTRAAYAAAAPHTLPAAVLHLDIATLFSAGAVALTRGAAALIYGDDEHE